MMGTSSAYLLFFTFVVVMPVLFSNLLVCSQSIMHLVAYAWMSNVKLVYVSEYTCLVNERICTA